MIPASASEIRELPEGALVNVGGRTYEKVAGGWVSPPLCVAAAVRSTEAPPYKEGCIVGGGGSTPRQPVDRIVVREFTKQNPANLQQLRRDGWTFLHVSGGLPVHLDTSGSGTYPQITVGRIGNIDYTVLAERVEKVLT